MKKYILSVAASLFILSFSFAQDKSKADLAFEGQNYMEAIDLYKKEYTKAKGSEEKGRITYRMALSYDGGAFYEDAGKFYERAYNLDYQKYEPKLILDYAQNKLSLGDYNGAKSLFQEYLKKDPSNEIAKKGLESCNTVRGWLAEPTRFIVTNERVINSSNYDWCLTQYDKKGEEYIFSSSREGANGADTDGTINENYTDFFVTRRDKEGKWGEPKPLGLPINSEYHEGAAVVNSKGNVIYFTRCINEKKQNLGCDIYFSEKRGRNWKEPELIKLKDSSIYSVGHPTIDRREQILIFASDIPGGQGGKDLWITTYDKREKEWSKPVNLGSEINTKGDELFPYLTDDGDLYFSSNGHVGMGGLDIFKAQSIGDNKWGKIENMKAPINSFRDDYGITMLKRKSDQGFFTSNRDGGKGGDDIYSFMYPEDELRITVKVLASCDPVNEVGKPLEGATVNLTGSDGSTVKLKTDDQGMITFDEVGGGRYIKKDVNYTIVIEAKNHLNAKDKRSTFGVEGNKTFYHEFELQKTDCGEINMPSVQYVFGSAEFINNEDVNSADSLLYLYNIMLENPTIVAELQAHTDCRGSDTANQSLSQRRAQACVDYLVGKGIQRDRLVAKGYGESQPRTLQDGTVLTCDFITEFKATDPKKFERYHQLNRRTTFSILRTDYNPNK